MKILKIRFENIHSLKGEHEIDFGEGILADAGLFAITGPTGSGKSTLLDVITLALYNRIARVDKTVSNSILEDDGGIMTRNMKSCFAEVEYRVNGKNYRSHWSIERNRNNNLNARKQELVEVATQHILEEGTKTPQKNQEIIGLSYEQFVKAMVLSQGEFSKLLQAPRNERNKLLEDITGARSYREIGKAVYFRYKQVEKNIALKEAGLETIALLTKEEIEERQSKLKALTQSKPTIEKAYESASERINNRKELQKKQTEQKALQTEQLQLKKDWETFHPYKGELEQHDKLAKYGAILADFDAITKQELQFKEASDKLGKSKSLATIQLNSLLEDSNKLLGEKVDVTTVSEKLEVFRNKIVQLQAEEKNKQKEASLFQEQVSIYINKVNQLGYPLPMADKPELLKPQIDAVHQSIQSVLQSSGANSLEQLDLELETLRNLNEKAGDFLNAKEQHLKLQKNQETQLAKLKEVNEQLAKNRKIIGSLEKEVGVASKEIESLEKSLEQQRKHQSLEAYRSQLEPEQPCPLCGSLHHPYASDTPHFDANEELLNEKKKSLQKDSTNLINLKANTEFLQKGIPDINSGMATLKEEGAKYEETLYKLGQQLKWDYKNDLATLQSNRHDLNRRIKNMERSKQAFQAASIFKDIEERLKQWELALTSYTKLKQQRTALFFGPDINKKVHELSTSITRSSSAISSLKEQIKENADKLKSISSEKVKKETELKGIIFKEELDSLQSLRSGILPEERASKIRRRESQLKEIRTKLTEIESSLKKALVELLKKDDPTLSMEDLTTLFKDAKTNWDNLSVTIGKISQSLEEDKKARQRQQKVQEEIDLLKKDLSLWKTMNDLIGDATGNKFSNFVQDLTLEQLIGYANKRLSEFSDRYLLDIPTAEEAEKSDTLKVYDKYMGNARRSVRTLSGGETFLVSLAMAFALSDIAAKNVKIESLFIDEGFGTLDPETLDQAITILEKMQNEGDKSVGVISHVSALKERITTQIQLEKGSLGYSTLKVVQ
ncbi:SbcC/MukB-like Walker B domain-containing protein [Arenibacter lacus]|uniref:SbcC/MukB-like Walker B domain-containing protein n=1 Tax=Arenibacter lacus TaxID=2608629 RepID=UPI00123DF70E|nr:SbcC/MukB-like Walker B domain-containing protein [Arenibacter lacus]